VTGLESSQLLQRFLAAGAVPRTAWMNQAVKAGRRENVLLLLAAGTDPNSMSWYEDPLRPALEGVFDDIAFLLVEAGARGGRNAGTAVAEAAYSGCETAMRAMISAGFPVDGRATIDPGKRLRRKKAQEELVKGFSAVVGLMSQIGEAEQADRDGGDGSQWFPLLSKVEDFRADLKQAEPAAPRSFVYESSPALVIAAGEGHRPIVELLAAAGADLSQHDDAGFTAYAAARRCGHHDLACRIEELGGAREPRHTPAERLLLAAQKGDAAGVRAALAAGADVESRDAREKQLGLTALLLAVTGDHLEAAAALVDAGARIDYPARKKKQELLEADYQFGGLRFPFGSPLTVAAVLDRPAVAGLLIARGADLKGSNRSSPNVALAAAKGSAKVLALLLAAGADPNTTTREGPPLVRAAQSGHSACVRLLLEHGADPNVRQDGDSPLHTAAILQDGESIAALLDHGADARSKNDRKRTPLDNVREYALISRQIVKLEFDPNGTPREPAPRQISPEVMARLEAATKEKGKRPKRAAPDVRTDTLIPMLEMPDLDPALAARYEWEAVCERLIAAARGETFLAAVAELAERCGSVAEQNPAGFLYSMHVHSASPLGREAKVDIVALQAEMKPRGLLVFGREQRLLVLPTTDPFEALAAMGTSGPNYDVTSGQVIEFFRRRPAILTGIGHDFASGHFDPLPDDLEKLAVEIINLCPDAFQPDTEDLEDLVERLEKGKFYLWWD
jgi:ankyrin repeat protein